MSRNRADAIVYRIGKWFWLVILLVGCIFTYLVFDNYVKDSYVCKLRELTGFPCPGCGMTRATVSFFRLRFRSSLIYNPGVIYLVLCYIHFMVLYFIRLHISKTIEQKPIKIEYYAYGLILVLVLQWVAKIVLLLNI